MVPAPDSRWDRQLSVRARGVEALATLAANHDVDLVVADINMPRSSSAASHSQQARRSSHCEHPKVAILARTNEEPQPKAKPYLW
jgi:DNA-binding NarL/FixJ family response regulator